MLSLEADQVPTEVMRQLEVYPDRRSTRYLRLLKVPYPIVRHIGEARIGLVWNTPGRSIGWLLGVDKNDQVVYALLQTGPEFELCRESFTTQWVKRGDSLVARSFQEAKAVVGVQWGGFNRLVRQRHAIERNMVEEH